MKSIFNPESAQNSVYLKFFKETSINDRVSVLN